MEQQARNVTMKDWGFPAHSRYLLHDGDGKFCPVLGEVIQAGKVKPPKLPAPLSEPECVCRVLGTLGERGMPVAVDLFRRAFVALRLNGVYRPFPPRTESSGQREQASVSRTTNRSNAAAGELCNAKNDSSGLRNTTRPEQHEYWLGLLF